MEPHVHGCTGKHKYATRELAEQVNAHWRKKRKGAKQMRYYQCATCGCWHASSWVSARQRRVLR